MDKFIVFDIDHKHTVACVVQAGQPDRYRKLRTEVGALRDWLVHGLGGTQRSNRLDVEARV